MHDRLRPGGAVLIDNVLLRGAVADEQVQDDSTRTMRALNDALVLDPRWDVAMLPIADGLTLLRKR